MNAVRALRLFGSGAPSAVGGNIGKAAREIEKHPDGKPVFKKNPNDDPYIMNEKGNKKVRFDINNPGHKPSGGRDKPHFHIEKLNEKGNWIDETPEHRNYFREKE